MIVLAFVKKYNAYILAGLCIILISFIFGVERPNYRKVKKELKASQELVDSLNLEFNAINRLNEALITKLDSSKARQAKYDSAKVYIHKQLINEMDIDSTIGIDSLARRLSDAAIRAYNL